MVVMSKYGMRFLNMVIKIRFDCSECSSILLTYGTSHILQMSTGLVWPHCCHSRWDVWPCCCRGLRAVSPCHHCSVQAVVVGNQYVSPPRRAVWPHGGSVAVLSPLHRGWGWQAV